MTHGTDNELAEGALHQALHRVALCYDRPGPAIMENLRELPHLLGRVDPEMADMASQLEQALQGDDTEELLKEYSRLFLGPFQLEAPPFGSVYLESEGRMMGDSTADAKRMYRESGLEMASDFQSPPDHVIAELEFLAFLGLQELESREQQDRGFFRHKREQFLQSHVGAWFPLFADKVEQNTQMAFYRDLSRLTRRLLEVEREELRGAPAVSS